MPRPTIAKRRVLHAKGNHHDLLYLYKRRVTKRTALTYEKAFSELQLFAAKNALAMNDPPSRDSTLVKYIHFLQRRAGVRSSTPSTGPRSVWRST